MTLEISGGRELILYLDNLSDRTLDAAAAGVRDVLTVLKARSEEKLSGEVLQVRSGDLKNSLMTSVERSGSEIDGTLQVDPGSAAAKYGFVHELGGTFQIPEHLRTSKLGNQFGVKAHSATFPERSFLRSSLADSEDELGQIFAESFLEALHA